MEYLIRFAQVHESFRLPEIKALATLAGVDLEVVFYDQFVRLLSSRVQWVVILKQILPFLE